MSAEENRNTKFYHINEDDARQDFIDNVLIGSRDMMWYNNRLICDKCNGMLTGYRWCNPCNATHFRNAFSTWTSGNLEIDYFIQNTQLYARSMGQALEWFPWELFSDVKKIGEGGNGTVFRAKRKGNAELICGWDKQNNEWLRLKRGEYHYNNSGYVALKSTNSKDILIEAKRLQRWEYKSTFIGTFLGFTKNEDGQYLLVLWYYTKGDLREYIRSQEISWDEKIRIIYWIARNLKDIHQAGLIHRDLHPGNVLNSIVEVDDLKFARIADLGLSISVLEADNIKEVWGVIPYLAPELLIHKSFSQAIDVYAFGIIMWEVSSGKKPFHDVAHDVDLVIKICSGCRPEITEDTPPLYKDLMEKCWHADPKKRPTAEQIYQQVAMWYDSPTREIQEQMNKSEKIRQQNIGIKKDIDTQPFQHIDAIYISRPLENITKELRATMKYDDFLISD